MTPLLNGLAEIASAALLAAGIALSAAWLANANSRRQLAMQLAADAEQRERDRRMTLRRDVYIPAAEAIAKIHSTIGDLADYGADQSLLGKRITADLGALAKTTVVGTDATVVAVSRLTTAAMIAYLQLTAARQKLSQRNHKIKAALAARDAAATQRQQLAELLRQAFISGNSDPTLLQHLRTQLDSDTEAASARQGELESLLQEQANEERELSLRILATNQELTSHIPDALIAVRREIDLPIDEAALRQIFADQQSAALAMTQRLLADTGTPPVPFLANS